MGWDGFRLSLITLEGLTRYVPTSLSESFYLFLYLFVMLMWSLARDGDGFEEETPWKLLGSGRWLIMAHLPERT